MNLRPQYRGQTRSDRGSEFGTQVLRERQTTVVHYIQKHMHLCLEATSNCRVSLTMLALYHAHHAGNIRQCRSRRLCRRVASLQTSPAPSPSSHPSPYLLEHAIRSTHAPSCPSTGESLLVLYTPASQHQSMRDTSTCRRSLGQYELHMTNNSRNCEEITAGAHPSFSRQQPRVGV